MKQNKEPNDKDRTEMGNDWREWREDARQHKKSAREANTETAQKLADTNDLQLVSYNDGTQLSFRRDGIRLDYFPTSGKILIGNKYFKAKLEATLKTHFKL